MTYGDDFLYATKDKKFTIKEFAKWCKICIGLDVTPATKQGELSNSFMSMDDCSFLKRRFKYHKGLDRIVSPLDPASIRRSIKWYLPSDAVSKHDQMKMTINAALMELFFHLDESDFDRIRDALVFEFKREFGVVGDFFTYYTIKEKFSS